MGIESPTPYIEHKKAVLDNINRHRAQEERLQEEGIPFHYIVLREPQLGRQPESSTVAIVQGDSTDDDVVRNYGGAVLDYGPFKTWDEAANAANKIDEDAEYQGARVEDANSSSTAKSIWRHRKNILLNQITLLRKGFLSTVSQGLNRLTKPKI